MKRLSEFIDPVDRAIYLTCRGHLDELARLHGITRQRAANKANPHDRGHYFSPHELIRTQRARQDFSVLEATAAKLGHVAVRVDSAPIVTPMKRLAMIAAKFADFVYAATDVMATPQGRPDALLRACWHALAAHSLALVDDLEGGGHAEAAG